MRFHAKARGFLFLAVTAFALFLFSRPEAMAVYQNVFSVKGLKGEVLLSTKDLKCISIDDDGIVTFAITESSARGFYEYSRNNLNKEVWVSICGIPPRKTTIETPIPGGRFEYHGLTRYQKNCIRESFQIERSCKKNNEE